MVIHCAQGHFFPVSEHEIEYVDSSVHRCMEAKWEMACGPTVCSSIFYLTGHLPTELWE